MPDKPLLHSDSDRRPVPDPTLLTTEALHREIGGLRELMDGRIDASSELMTEKFKGVDNQFQLLERQRIEQKKDTKDAVDAALTAQKEAVREQTSASERAIAKSETSVMKQLEQLGATFATASGGLRQSIDDLKERIGMAETRVTAAEQQKAGAKEDRSGLYAAAGFIVALLTIGGFFISRMNAPAPPQPVIQYVPAPTMPMSANAPVTIPESKVR